MLDQLARHPHPCVMLDQPAVDLKKIPMTTAWQQLLEEAKELVSHTECEGCHLRPVCNVCYAAAHCEKNNHRKHGLSLPDGESQRTDHYELSP